MRIVWQDEIKLRAVKLRREGRSLGEIMKELGVPRTTVFEWVKPLPRPERFNNREWIKSIQSMAVAALKKEKIQRFEKIRNESWGEVGKIEDIALEVKKMVLAILYWSEGSKTGSTVGFVNVDPRMCLLFVTLLRSCYQIDERKWRVRLHLHYYHKSSEIVRYWSGLLEIPISKFGKIYWKKRNKEKTFRRNFGGICTIRYNDINLKERILQYGYALGERLVGKRIIVPAAPVAQWTERVFAEDKI
ncbi:MAG: Uncharacterized protein G01um101416_269 [Microgenomates group bacterium Gr01-1014_16]|nr:MAG: Uncharacterized protein G01um101416_269 [Microgenomates group bacterium Gr01-1014_16]